MPTTVDESKVFTRLRSIAEAHLEAGTTPTTSHWSMGVDALRLLHRLSSDPDSAEDALKLLHELQVHQVELDLQNEEIATNERALVKTLSLYRELYDAAPIGYFLVDLMGNVVQGNHAAAEFFGIGSDDLPGQRIDSLISSHHKPLLLGLLRRVAETGIRGSFIAETGDDVNTLRQLQFLAFNSPKIDYILLACCECASTA